MRTSQCGVLPYYGAQALEHELTSCGAWAWLPGGVWDLPGPEIETVSLALAGRFQPLDYRGRPVLCIISNFIKFHHDTQQGLLFQILRVVALGCHPGSPVVLIAQD